MRRCGWEEGRARGRFEERGVGAAVGGFVVEEKGAAAGSVGLGLEDGEAACRYRCGGHFVLEETAGWRGGEEAAPELAVVLRVRPSGRSWLYELVRWLCLLLSPAIRGV